MTKVWAETLGEMYARVHGLSIIIARIGWFVRNEAEAEAMWLCEAGELPDLPAGAGFSMFLSHGECNTQLLVPYACDSRRLATDTHGGARAR
jgi:hypothetical protein